VHSVPHHRRQAEERLRLLNTALLDVISKAIDLSVPYNRGHCARVAGYSVAIADRLGLPDSDRERIRLAALLHDIGKIETGDSILNKRDRLSPSERAVIMQHPVTGAAILEATGELRDLVPGVRWHHEWLSGEGYPDGLQGDAIPLDARIIAVADAFDAMTTDRPYRPALSVADTVQRIGEGAGRHYDPTVVAALLAGLDSGVIAVPERPSGASAVGEADAEGYIKPVHGKELSVLYELSREDLVAHSLSSLVRRYVEAFEHLIDPSLYMVYLFDQETGSIQLEATSQPSHGADAEGKDLRLVRQALDTRCAVVADDTRALPTYRTADPSTKSEVVIPLIAQRELQGALVVEAALPGHFQRDDLAVLRSVGQQLANSIKLFRYQEHLTYMANHDSLTGVLNHRYLQDRLAGELERSAREQDRVSVVVLDLNGLKQLNDTYGHLAGDLALREFGCRLKDAVREQDAVARYGGDEFAIILPGTDKREALAVVRRLKQSLECAFQYKGSTIPLCTAAWGVATFPEDGLRAKQLIEKADRMMYRNKRETSRRIRHAPPLAGCGV